MSKSIDARRHALNKLKIAAFRAQRELKQANKLIRKTEKQLAREEVKHSEP